MSDTITYSSPRLFDDTAGKFRLESMQARLGLRVCCIESSIADTFGRCRKHHNAYVAQVNFITDKNFPPYIIHFDGALSNFRPIQLDHLAADFNFCIPDYIQRNAAQLARCSRNLAAEYGITIEEE